MKPNRLITTLLLLLGYTAFSQDTFRIPFQSGAILPPANLRSSYIDSFQKQLSTLKGRSFFVIQFSNLPGSAERKLLSASGVELQEYLGGNAYTAAALTFPLVSVWKQARVRSLLTLHSRQKMDPFLASNVVPKWAEKHPGFADVLMAFPSLFTAAEVAVEVQAMGGQVIDRKFETFRILKLRLPITALDRVAALPMVSYMQAAPPGDQPLNFDSRAVSGAGQMNASVANGGRGLDGDGVVVGVGDNADLQFHVDFWGRLINRAPLPPAGHGTHVAGTVAGAGNINPLYIGFAPKATIISQLFSGILSNASTYVQDHGMVITNNSYGYNFECDYYGRYDLISNALDQMAFDLPHLTNVFAAGNSARETCPPYALGFRTVLGGYQSAKNVITVGATNDSGTLAVFSSRGPVRDGRMKPDLTAMGEWVPSAWPTNIYGYNNGTSMAAPAVSGGLALLYQRYRQLHGGSNPKNALMKALLMNGAIDRGNAGPDFRFGTGWMHLIRSVEMLENNRYFNTTVAQGTTNTHTVVVPANAAQLKVLLYWNDPAASPLSSRTLVNDLDLQVLDPTGNVVLPRVLDTTLANINNTAMNGVDRLNNAEQVIIPNPVAGTYTIRVIGSAIAQGSQQEYVVAHDVVPTGLRITAPAGGEAWFPSTGAFDLMKVTWESFGFTSGTLTLEFSADGGATWTTLASNMDVNRTVFTWFVPNLSTSQAMFRLSRNGGSEVVTSGQFTISPLPVVSLAPVQCEGYISLGWTAVPNATSYDVMILRGHEMTTVANTTGNGYTFSGLSKDSAYWVTVRPLINGRPGRRAIAVQRQPNNGTCAGAISNGDLAMDAIVSPNSGRRFTSSQLNNSVAVSVQVRNLDDVDLSNFDLSYSINNGSWITEMVPVTIAANGTYLHTFSATADLSAVGTYIIRTVVKRAGDGVVANDTLVKVVKQIDNQPINLSAAFIDNLETAQANTYPRDTMGLNGIERYDFVESTSSGRVRTFVNTGMAHSGNRALTLDVERFIGSGNTNYLRGTFNLGSYNVVNNDVRLDFRLLNHGQGFHPNNKVWIRGSETQPWIKVYDLDSAQDDPGSYLKSASIEISDALANAGQAFTPGFQVQWGQWGRLPAGDRFSGNGYTLDDIRLYMVQNDVQLRSLDAPLAVSCGLSNAVTIRVTVRNSANNTITNVPVRYRVNGGPWVSEMIPSISGNASVQYQFGATANLAAQGSHTIQTLVDLPTDSYRDNDTLTTVIRNQPIISSFPYLQNFENNDGFWYSGGENSSWQYGTLASRRISKAASGTKAWKTQLQGTYNDRELSYLYSPCFDVTSMTKPTLSFSVALDLEDCGTSLCDAAWVEYSTDGINWVKLDTTAGGSHVNWYNKTSGRVWSVQNYTYWHVATVPLPAAANRLRLRFVLASDDASSREGIAVDDIHIYDNTRGIYDGVTMSSPAAQAVAGSGWTDVLSNGKLVASLQPSGQNLGNTAVQAFIFGGAVRNHNNQYYHHRNITIKPENNVSDSVSVRFYFTDFETDTLLRDTGCSTCLRPASAYELGVSQYSDPDRSFENSSIDDNQQGLWQFIVGSRLAIVPFDKGYYAEFKVKGFSEFWLNNGGFDRSTPLPVKLMDITVQKQGANDVLVSWKVGSETNVLRYEIELARGDAAMQGGQFQKIGEEASRGNATSVRNYTFSDTEADKFGPRYYRLKIVNADGSFLYSPVRMVLFDEAQLWQVYPNPSSGEFFLVYQAQAGQALEASIYDQKGRLLKMLKTTGTGTPQKLLVDLRRHIASGVYLMQVSVGDQKRSFKLYKR